MPSIEKTIPLLDTVTSASNTALIPVSDGGDAKGMTRLQYCRISAEGGQATYVYDQNGDIRAELGGVQGCIFYGPETAPAVQAYIAIQAGGITLVDEEGNPALSVSDPTGVVVNSLTASRALVSGASKQLASSATTATELSYVNGVTSAIQTQIDSKGSAPTQIDLGTASGAQVVSLVAFTTTLTANGATSLTTSNRVAARSNTIKITASGADRTITPSASWVWVGSDYSAGLVIPSGKVAIITLTCFGTAETDIVAAAAIQP